MSRAWGTVWVLVAVVVAMGLGWARPLRPGLRSEGTNVVVVVAASARAGELTPYGGHPDATPAFASAAKRGVRYTDVLDVGIPHGLAERLAAAGYATFRASALDGFPLEGGPAGSPAIDHVLRGVEHHRPGAPIFVQVVLADAADDRPVAPFLAERFGGGDLGGYRARLARLDEAVSRLAAGLDAQGYHEGNTLFAVVGLGEAPVPWLIWGAGVEPGRVIDTPATTADVAPTVLDLVGVACQPGHESCSGATSPG